MPVLNSLALDHFYISLPKDIYEKYKAFFALLDGIHQSVAADDDSWDGVYSYTRIRDYFEILKDRRSGGLGIALSPVGLVNVNVNRIMTEQSHLDWNHGTRNHSNKEPWFDWYSLGSYTDITNTFFNVWIMDYHKNHIEYSQKLNPKKIDSFVSLEMRLGANSINEICHLLSFSDYLKSSSSDEILISIPRRDGWEFNIKISLVQGDEKFTPLKLSLNLYNLSENTLMKIDQYDFVSRKGNFLTISF